MTDAKSKPTKGSKQDKSGKTDSIPTDQWQTELVTALTKEVYNLIQREEQIHGQEFADMVRLSFLASFVSTVVYQVLTTPVTIKASEKKKIEIVNVRYQDIKEAVQNAVASGFQGAMQTFSGTTQPYFCQISPEPEAANKLAC